MRLMFGKLLFVVLAPTLKMVALLLALMAMTLPTASLANWGCSGACTQDDQEWEDSYACYYVLLDPCGYWER